MDVLITGKVSFLLGSFEITMSQKDPDRNQLTRMTRLLESFAQSAKLVGAELTNKAPSAHEDHFDFGERREVRGIRVHVLASAIGVSEKDLSGAVKIILSAPLSRSRKTTKPQN